MDRYWLAPVGDRAEVEQHRAAVPEEAAGDPHPPALGQRRQRVEQQQRAGRPDAELVYRVEQVARAGDRRALAGVEDLDPGPPRGDLSGVAGGDDIPRDAEVVPALRDGVVEQLLGDLAALPHPYHVVAPVQTVEGTVELGHPGAGRFISHASNHTPNRKPENSHVTTAIGPETDPGPARRPEQAYSTAVKKFGI